MKRTFLIPSRLESPDRTNIERQNQAYVELDRDEVGGRALRLWMAAGGPAGRVLEFWLQAIVELLVTPGSASEEALAEWEAVAWDLVASGKGR